MAVAFVRAHMNMHYAYIDAHQQKNEVGLELLERVENPDACHLGMTYLISALYEHTYMLADWEVILADPHAMGESLQNNFSTKLKRGCRFLIAMCADFDGTGFDALNHFRNSAEIDEFATNSDGMLLVNGTYQSVRRATYDVESREGTFLSHSPPFSLAVLTYTHTTPALFACVRRVDLEVR